MNKPSTAAPAPSPALQPPSVPERRTESLTEQSSQQVSETSATAMATKSRAEIEAAYIMARKFPRNEADARVKILKTCQIPSFAEKAKYAKPIGNTRIVGPSIRLAEEIARQWGHIDVETSLQYEDRARRVIQIRTIDLQTGSTNRTQTVIEKTVERANAVGREVVGERLNSSGAKIHIVVATEDEVFVKQNAIASKFRRNLILQLIPTYILEDAMAAVDETVRSGAKANPDLERRKVCDNFGKLNIMPSDLAVYLGHPVEQMTPDEIVDLKTVFTSILDGHTNWKEVLATKDAPVVTEKIEKGIIDLEPQPENFPTPSEFDAAHNKWAANKNTFKAGDAATHQSVEAPVTTKGGK